MVVRRRLMWLMPLGCAIALTNCQELDQLFQPSYEAQLAEHLSTIGAKMYGAYWCPHCARQKQLFGDAARLLPYVECDPRGANPQVDVCNAVGINAYPTWEINGGFYLGAQPLTQLADLSDFERPSGSSGNEPGGRESFSPAQ